MVSEEELREKAYAIAQEWIQYGETPEEFGSAPDIEDLLTLIHQYGNTRELEGKLQEYEMLQHQARVNLKSAEAVAQWSEIRVKQVKGEE